MIVTLLAVTFMVVILSLRGINWLFDYFHKED